MGPARLADADERDAALVGLIQQATLDRAEGIELTDTDIVVPQRVELGVAVGES